MYPGEVKGSFSTLDINAFSCFCITYCVIFVLDVNQSSDVDVRSNVPRGVSCSIPDGSNIWFDVKCVYVDGYFVTIIVMWVWGGFFSCGWVNNMGFA